MKENAPPETMTTPEGPGGGDRATSPGLPASALVTGVEGDRVRWGPVWTGALTTLSINVVLQLLFYALGWLDLGTENGTTASVVSAVLGLVAFLLGGFAAGASAGWRRAGDGMVNGVVSWTLTAALLLVLGLVGAGAVAGSFAYLVSGLGALGHPGGVSPSRDAAGWTVLGLGLSVLASALGGAVGARLWPPGGQRHTARH